MHVEKYDLYIPTDIANKTVLDYGCGNGNLTTTIDPKFYTGFEVDAQAYAHCCKCYPQYNFVHQNLYNCVYNATGEKKLPTLNKQYDIIFAYSVFTHTSYEYFLACMKVFQRHASEIYVSMITTDNTVLLDYLYQKRTKKYGSCDLLDDITDNCVYLADNKLVANTVDCEDFVAIYHKDFLQQHGTIVDTTMNQEIYKIVS